MIMQPLELDACLTGLGGRIDNWVYHLPIEKGYENCTIVHLEMVNILLAVRTFVNHWKGHKILIKCDNQAVVSVLTSGRTRDPYLAVCAKNIIFRVKRKQSRISCPDGLVRPKIMKCCMLTYLNVTGFQ